MNVNDHLCTEWDCPICHPKREQRAPVVENPVDNPDPVVDNSPSVVDNPVEKVEAFPEWNRAGDDEVREEYVKEAAMGPFAYALFLEEKLREARDMVLWFSRKWGDDLDPLFPFHDEMTGAELPGNRRLSRVWYEVVRHGVVCETCEGTRGTRHDTHQERVFTFEPCAACEGRGYFEDKV